jgi:hypothetical protein
MCERAEFRGPGLANRLQTVIFGEISGICKTRIQQQQTAAAEFGTFLLKTAMGAYGGQNSPSETSLGPESSFSLNLYVQSLRPAHRLKLNR